jgi:UDP-N-acetylglucosamine--N-acetylmuramyl-(pentapeptide) pyrophosphoryl-undecaprenol N-acetylglucosamine transferase
MERIVLTTGGTGGHIFPAISVARAVQAGWPGCRILFVGGNIGPEARMAEEAGIDFQALPAKGILGRGARSIGAFVWIVRAMWGSLGILRSFSPQVVAGFGGYASFCPVMAARLLGIPTVIHEQNSVPGMANRFLARRARKVMTSFPDQGGLCDQGRIVLTGNPVRPEIAALAGREKPVRTQGPLRLLVLGGSQGAHALNLAVTGLLEGIRDTGLEIRHQTGARDLDEVRRAYRAAGLESARVEGFVSDMAEAYGWADLVLCRAGASTIAELTAAGLPSVLVPFPFAAGGHQRINAQYLSDAGAALLLDQEDMTPAGLLEMILGLERDRQRLAAMARAAGRLGRPGAADRVAESMAEVARG